MRIYPKSGQNPSNQNQYYQKCKTTINTNSQILRPYAISSKMTNHEKNKKTDKRAKKMRPFCALNKHNYRKKYRKKSIDQNSS